MHVERAALIVGVSGMATLVVWRATLGDFPVRFGNFQFESERVAQRTDRALERQIHTLEVVTGIRREHVLEEDRDES